VAAIAREAGAKVVVDNVFATPLFQSPLPLGADVVVYSATKHMDGQGRVLGGALLCSKALFQEAYHDQLATPARRSPLRRLGADQGAGDPGPAGPAAGGDRRRPRRADRAHPKVGRLFYPTRPDHPQAEIAARQMTGGGTSSPSTSATRRRRSAS
jgi:O-succinylhomoserine sulfhydrylase